MWHGWILQAHSFFLFITAYYCIVWVYHSCLSVCTGKGAWLLQILAIMNKTDYKHLREPNFSVHLCKHLGTWVLGHILNLCLAYLKTTTANLSSRGLVLFIKCLIDRPVKPPQPGGFSLWEDFNLIHILPALFELVPLSGGGGRRNVSEEPCSDLKLPAWRSKSFPVLHACGPYPHHGNSWFWQLCPGFWLPLGKRICQHP